MYTCINMYIYIHIYADGVECIAPCGAMLCPYMYVYIYIYIYMLCPYIDCLPTQQYIPCSPRRLTLFQTEAYITMLKKKGWGRRLENELFFWRFI